MKKAFSFAKLVILGIISWLLLSGCSTVPTVKELHFVEVTRAVDINYEKIFSEGGDLTQYGYEAFFGKSHANDFTIWQNMKPTEKLAFLEASPLIVARSLFVWERDAGFKAAFKEQHPELSDLAISLHIPDVSKNASFDACITEKWMSVDSCVFFLTPVADLPTQVEAKRRIEQYRETVMLRLRGQTAADIARRQAYLNRHSVNRPLTRPMGKR